MKFTLQDMFFESMDNLNYYEKCECGNLFSTSRQHMGYFSCPNQLTSTTLGIQTGHYLTQVSAKEYYKLKRSKGK